MDLGLFLAFLALAGFFVYFIFKNGTVESYLLFIVYVLPLMDLKLVPFDYGNLKVFDFITLLTLGICYRGFFRKPPVSAVIVVLLVLFGIVLILGSIASEFPQRALLTLISVATPFIFCRFLFTQISKDPEFIIQFFRGVKFACVVAIGFVIMQVVAGPQHFTFYSMLNQNVLGEQSTRYPGFFMDAQLSGVFFAMISFVWLLSFSDTRQFSSKQLLLFTITLGGLMMTGSRSPMIGVAGALVFMLILFHGNFRYQLLRFVALGGVAAILAFATTNVFHRFNDMDESISFRQNIWDGALDIFKEHPVLGIGSNNYKAYVERHAQGQSILLEGNEVLYLDFPENGYLKLLVEWGIIAFVLLMLIILAPLYGLLRNYFAGYKVSLSVVFGAMIICWAISNVSVYTLSDVRITALLCIALTMLVFTNKKEIIFSKVD